MGSASSSTSNYPPTRNRDRNVNGYDSYNSSREVRPSYPATNPVGQNSGYYAGSANIPTRTANQISGNNAGFVVNGDVNSDQQQAIPLGDLSNVEAQISWSDMIDINMRSAAVFVAKQAYNAYNVDEDRAIHCKTNFQNWYNYGAWHCIVGSLFGSRVTHDRGHFINIQIRDKCFLLWKCGTV